MTQKKLEILGPYTLEHEGPYAIDSAINAEVLFVKVNIHCIVDGIAFVTTEDRDGPWCVKTSHLMNAREVPVAREFWVNEYAGGGLSVYSSKEEAENYKVCLRRRIHVREVLPGEGA
ncbi:hypothetical protein ACQ5TV_05785 [Acetobacter ghanensis]|uniref:hypothetical protein n=1 Tax=Acetobacter ghanensis TaxID=431306 RepID=UPI003D336F31